MMPENTEHSRVGRNSRSLAAQDEYDQGYLDCLEAFTKHQEIGPGDGRNSHYKDGWKAAKELLAPKTCSICGGKSHEMEQINSKDLCRECAIEARDLQAMGRDGVLMDAKKESPPPSPGAAGIYLSDSFGNCARPKGVGVAPAPWGKLLAEFPMQIFYVGF